VNWRIKGLTQKALAHTPGGWRLNSLLQQRFGGLRSLETNVDTKVRADWLVLIDHLQRLSWPLDCRYVEIGTGWYPTLPICFHLVGGATCHTYDVSPLLDIRLTKRMLARVETHLPDIAAKTGVNLHLLHNRLTYLREATSFDELFARTGIEYHAPADATATGLPSRSVDVVFSNSVLEHVSQTTLDNLMKETRRILRPGGLAVHSVNCGDHYAYFDRSISPINYLRYTASHWRLWNNHLQFQNRLRADDFLASAQRAGLELVLNRQRPRPELMATLESFHIAPEFKRYSPEQLCTTSVDFVARAPDDRTAN
jgi:SAM-dependent methyltransferase